MRLKSLRHVVFLSIAVPFFFLVAVYAVATPEFRTQAGGPGGQTVRVIEPEQRPSFISNTILVKLTPQARANLRVTGENVNPAATGISSLDDICRDAAVQSFRSIITSDASHQDHVAAVNSWHKLTLRGPEQRLTLIEQ